MYLLKITYKEHKAFNFFLYLLLYVDITCMCGHSLSSGLKLADLKPDQQVILADTLTQVGLGDGVQLGGWN